MVTLLNCEIHQPHDASTKKSLPDAVGQALGQANIKTVLCSTSKSGKTPPDHIGRNDKDNASKERG